MRRNWNLLLRRALPALALGSALLLPAAPPAHAADSIYWLNREGGSISHANLSGGGGGTLPNPMAGPDSPSGMAIDPSTGRIYWADSVTKRIGFSSLDGAAGGTLDTAGAPFGGPNMLSIDTIGDRIYWADEGTETISFANLSGGGGRLDTGSQAVSELGSLVVHPAAGRVYWEQAGAIVFASSLTGGGVGTLVSGGIPDNSVTGLAIDASSGRLYWADPVADAIRFIGLNGGPIGTLATGNAPIANPGVLAIDPVAERIYWTNEGNNTIGFASLRGAGGAQFDTTGAGVVLPGDLVLLKTPVSPRPPQVSGRQRGGSRLSCESTWANDLPESFLFRAPQTVAYQWLRNGVPVAGATAETVKATKVGSYACRATATNFAGSTTTATSNAIAVRAALKLGRLKLNPLAGTATLRVAAFGAGKLTLSGKGIKSQSTRARESARLKIRPKPDLKRRLERNARARVKVTVTFRPDGDKPIRRSKALFLRKAGVSRP